MIALLVAADLAMTICREHEPEGAREYLSVQHRVWITLGGFEQRQK